jgi:hypothetical protein
LGSGEIRRAVKVRIGSENNQVKSEGGEYGLQDCQEEPVHRAGPSVKPSELLSRVLQKRQGRK